MSSSDESRRRLSFRLSGEWLQRVDEWRVRQPRPLSRAEAIGKLVERGLGTEPGKDGATAESGKVAATGKNKRSLPGTEADFYIHAKTVSAFNGVLSILGVLVAKQLVTHKQLAQIHESMSKPFSGKRDEGRFIIADAQRRLDDLLAQLGRSLKPPKSQ